MLHVLRGCRLSRSPVQPAVRLTRKWETSPSRQLGRYPRSAPNSSPNDNARAQRRLGDVIDWSVQCPGREKANAACTR